MLQNNQAQRPASVGGEGSGDDTAVELGGEVVVLGVLVLHSELGAAVVVGGGGGVADVGGAGGAGDGDVARMVLGSSTYGLVT